MSFDRQSRAWPRFRRDRRAIRCAGLFGLAFLVTLLFLPATIRWFNVQDVRGAVRHPPSWRPASGVEVYTPRPVDAPVGTYGKAVGWVVHASSGWFGYDDLGRSLMIRVSLGSLVSVAVGLGAAAISVLVGVGWGAASALVGGRLDAAMMRFVDLLYGLPYVLFVILLKVVLEQPLTRFFEGRGYVANIVILFLAIGAVSWLTLARVVRGQVLALRQQPFFEAARSLGVGPWRLFRRHVWPNLVGPVVVYATLVVPQAILSESFLSFLGLGVPSPLPSLGRLAAEGLHSVNTFVGFWWMIVFPCAVLAVLLLALNFIGDGLRDALDPTSDAATMV